MYTAKELEDCDVGHLITGIPKLLQDDSRLLEGNITIEEAEIALQNMKHGKSPCTDGFGADFV